MSKLERVPMLDFLGPIDMSTYPMTNYLYPIILNILYVLIITIYYYGFKPSKPKRTILSNILLTFHNIGLCIFSLLCFYNTSPIGYEWFKNGFKNAICNDLIVNEYTNLWGKWSYYFYLSKYYEYMDTFIIVWKGSKPSFLQKFHHIGAVIGMWIVIVTKTHTSYVFVLPNSFIHSILYFYYALKVWKIPFPVMCHI